MNILITSGGTKIPIDSVRSITNMSKGTFGAKIATDCLNRGNHVTFLTHKSAKSPMQANLNFMYHDDSTWLYEKYKWAQSVFSLYTEVQYDTFWEYAGLLEDQVRKNPDAILLACAASDYEVVDPVEGKVRTSAQMNIELKPLPKLISKIRNEWNYTGILVGFKLLVGASEEELIESARKSVVENGCDFVIANDLNDIKNGNHKITIVKKYKEYKVPKEKAINTIINQVEILDAYTIRNNR